MNWLNNLFNEVIPKWLEYLFMKFYNFINK